MRILKKFIKLSVWVAVANVAIAVRADSFLLPVKSSVCTEITQDKTRSEIRYQTYDKAAFMAVKTSSYMQQHASKLDDHSYNLLSYKLVDKALNDVSLTTLKDDDEKICLEFTGNLDTQKADKLLASEGNKGFNPENVKEIAQEITANLPKSLYETNETIPLLYIKELEFNNHTTTNKYTDILTQKLSFEPRVLITESSDLADYFLVPKLLLAKVEKIDDENSKFSMSVCIELQNTAGVLIDSKQQNRYIIISNKKNIQEIAQKILIKLLEDATDNLTGQLNNLLKI